MSFNIPFVTAVFISFCFGLIYTQIDIIPERGGVYEFNEKYIKYAKFFVNRYGRKSMYYANLEVETNCLLNNNVTMEIIFFEKLGNEYKRSFIEIRHRMCDLVNKDQFIGTTVRATGLPCPLPKGEYQLLNMTLKKVTFPYKWPFEYARADANFYQTETREMVASGYLYIHLNQRKKVKSSKK